MLLEITYGYKAGTVDDKAVVDAKSVIDGFAEATAIATFFVNWMPFRKFPLLRC